MTTARTAVTGNAGTIRRSSGETPDRSVAPWRGAAGAKSGSATTTRPATTLASGPTDVALWGSLASCAPVANRRNWRAAPREKEHLHAVGTLAAGFITACIASARLVTSLSGRGA